MPLQETIRTSPRRVPGVPSLCPETLPRAVSGFLATIKRRVLNAIAQDFQRGRLSPRHLILYHEDCASWIMAIEPHSPFHLKATSGSGGGRRAGRNASNGVVCQDMEAGRSGPLAARPPQGPGHIAPSRLRNASRWRVGRFDWRPRRRWRLMREYRCKPDRRKLSRRETPHQHGSRMPRKIRVGAINLHTPV